MTSALRSWIAGVIALASSAAAAAGWSVTLPDGRQVAIVTNPAAAIDTQLLERRLPDGNLDRQFGKDGRVTFSLGADSPGARSLRVDSSGRLLVVGAAIGLQQRTVAASLRFLNDGRLDLSWGVQGRSLIPSPGAEAVGVDVLPMPDESVLVLGQVEGDSAEHAALWRLGSNGVPDADFGEGGVMRATGLEASEGLGLQRDDDGAALVAVLSIQQGMVWLEVHRWQPGQASPLRVARQPMPMDWQGPVILARRGGAWQWFDASEPITSGGVPLVAVAAMATWSNPLKPLGGQPAPAPSTVSEGGAAWNPFSSDGRPASADSAIDPDVVEPPWAALVVIVLTVLGGVARWRWRRHEWSGGPGGPGASASMSGPVVPPPAATRKQRLPADEPGTLSPRRLVRSRGIERETGTAALRNTTATAVRTPQWPKSPGVPVPTASADGGSASGGGSALASAHEQVPPRVNGGPGGRLGGGAWRDHAFAKPERLCQAALRAALTSGPERVTVWVNDANQQGRRLTQIEPRIRLARHRVSAWLDLLNRLDRTIDPQATVQLLCDARTIPRHASVTAWLTMHERFTIHAVARPMRCRMLRELGLRISRDRRARESAAAAHALHAPPSVADETLRSSVALVVAGESRALLD